MVPDSPAPDSELAPRSEFVPRANDQRKKPFPTLMPTPSDSSRSAAQQKTLRASGTALSDEKSFDLLMAIIGSTAGSSREGLTSPWQDLVEQNSTGGDDASQASLDLFFASLGESI
jgi:hypothetical protein